MNLGELFWWVKIHRIFVVILTTSGIRYEIEGCPFYRGVYLSRFENGKKVGRDKIKNFYLLPDIPLNEIKGIWLYFSKSTWPERPGVEILKGAIERFPKKASKKTLREYFILPHNK